MKRGWTFLTLVISIIFLFSILFAINVKGGGGKAGVGVESPPPQFNEIRLTEHENTIRVYLTITDINSWEDIYSVNIILEDAGVEKARFIFEQYSDVSTWDKINEFSEVSKDNNLLITKKCQYDTLDKEETLKGCYLNLLFVFETTWFTQMIIIADDRGGATASLELDYSTEDIIRSGDIIIIPGINESITLEIPSYLLDIIALVIASLSTWYIVKKTDVGNIMRAIYEKNN